MQYISYICALEDPDRFRFWIELGALIVWTVAVAYTIVIITSQSALPLLYELWVGVGWRARVLLCSCICALFDIADFRFHRYGFWPFWAGNILLHYLPAVVYTFAIRSPLRAIGERLVVFAVLALLIIFYNLTHDTHEVYHNDTIAQYDGMGYMILAAFVLQVNAASGGLLDLACSFAHLLTQHLKPQKTPKLVVLDYSEYICTTPFVFMWPKENKEYSLSHFPFDLQF